jgi:pyrroline-5-carboxylate reductase
MNKNINLGVIGFGKMAEAICAGAHNAHKELNISFFEKNDARRADILKKYPSFIATDLKSIAKSEFILLAVKPQTIDIIFETLPEIKPTQCIISILAGTPIEKFESAIGKLPIVRVMPNTPALIGESMTAISYNSVVSSYQKQIIKMIFDSIGVTLETDEKNINIITALSGSGPAYFYKIAESMALEAKKEGFDEETATTLVAQTMIGAGNMILKSNKSVATLISDVSSPNGTTVAGLSAFEDTSLIQDLGNIVRRAYERAKELSK